jgi:Cys-tRNA(Pro)/Cys-tRNA(Cys) deacylase
MSKIHARVLAAFGEFAPIRVIEHQSLGKTIRSPSDFAEAIGYELRRIAKTVLLANSSLSADQRMRRPHLQYAAACLPTSSRIDLREMAKILNWSRAELSTRHELTSLLDFPPGGVSPFGLGAVPLIFDRSLLLPNTILVGAGIVGVEIEVSSQMLVDIGSGQAADIRLPEMQISVP